MHRLHFHNNVMLDSAIEWRSHHLDTPVNVFVIITSFKYEFCNIQPEML